MAQIFKKVDRGITETQRSQVFTQADGSTGTIFLVEASLGKPARTVQIEADAAMTVKFNVLRTIYPAWPDAGGAIQNPRLNLAAGQVVEDESMAVLTIGANETFALKDDMAVSDIKVVSAAGNFEIFVA